jgi:hypothetical protein
MELENIMLSKPGSERQRSHMFSHRWDINPTTYICIITHTHMYIQNISKSLRTRDEERREKERNDKE